MEMKFYRCEVCGQIVAIVKKKPCPVTCCGRPMQEMIPGSVDASAEKHVPVVAREGGKVVVSVGSAAHPMAEEHYIEWIALKTKGGNQRKALKPGDAPQAVFCIAEDDEIEAAFALCNLHGLWKA